MSSRFGPFPEVCSKRTRAMTRHHSALRALSEKQVEAYLIARDTLRRVRQTKPVHLPSRGNEAGATANFPRRITGTP